MWRDATLQARTVRAGTMTRKTHTNAGRSLLLAVCDIGAFKSANHCYQEVI